MRASEAGGVVELAVVHNKVLEKIFEILDEYKSKCYGRALTSTPTKSTGASRGRVSSAVLVNAGSLPQILHNTEPTRKAERPLAKGLSFGVTE